MTNQESSSVAKSMNSLRTEIKELSNQLNKVNKEKENWFAKKEALNKEIATLIGKLRTGKEEIEKTKATKEQKKTERSTQNKKFSHLLSKIMKIGEARKKILTKNRVLNLSGIEKRIAELELKTETEALPFETEKKVMAKIKELEKKRDAARKVSAYGKEKENLSQEMDEVKQDAEGFHLEVKVMAVKNREKIEEYRDQAKKINQLKKEQREAFKQFIEKKKIYVELNKQLKQKLRESKKFAEKSHTIQKHKQQSIEQQVEEKAKEVEKKLKERKKITTNDLIVLQGIKRK